MATLPALLVTSGERDVLVNPGTNPVRSQLLEIGIMTMKISFSFRTVALAMRTLTRSALPVLLVALVAPSAQAQITAFTYRTSRAASTPRWFG